MNILNRTRRIIKSAVIGGSAAAVLVVSPVAFAHGSSHDDNGKSSNSQRVASSSQQKHDSDRKHNDDWRRHRAERQKTCTEKQAAINQKATSTKDRDTKKLNGLNIILSGTQTYVTTGGVTVANYDALNAAATTDQTNATAAVNAIVAPTLNCTDDSAASANDAAVADFYSKVRVADQSLSTYKHDVNNLFEAAINS